MKRSGFKRSELPPRAKPVHKPLAEPSRAVLRRVDGNARCTVIPKSQPVRSEAYRRLVAILPCDICGIDRFSQAAHPNTGKSMGGKTDDRLCFPLCCGRPLIQGCHARFDQGALMTKAERRIYEPEAGRRTRDRINQMGLWPSTLEQIDT